jgi:hypothetical protein
MDRMTNMLTKKMTWDKAAYLEAHGFALDTPEAEQAWQDKCVFMLKRWPDHQDIEYYRSFVAGPVETGKERFTMVLGDIKPYRSMIDGSMIESRSKHRTHLRDHNCIEVGNETKHLKSKPMQAAPGLKDEIIRQTYMRKS